MSDKIKVTNPFSGQSEMLTLEEHILYKAVKQDEIDENYNEMQVKINILTKELAKIDKLKKDEDEIPF